MQLFRQTREVKAEGGGDVEGGVGEEPLVDVGQGATGRRLQPSSERLDQLWVQVSLVLVSVAGLLLAAVIVPEQRRILAAVHDSDRADEPPLARIRGASGALSLLWVAALVLMVVKPW